MIMTRVLKYMDLIVLFLILLLCFFIANNLDNNKEKQEISNTRVIEFGEIEQDGDFQNGKEKIEWYILNETSEDMLLISKDIILTLPYSVYYDTPTYEKSTIRYYLNSEFFNNSFTEEEKERILTINVENNYDNEFGIWCGNNTSDKVSILSAKEYEKYYDIVKNAELTKYLSDVNIFNAYWLRDMGYTKHDAKYIDINGIFNLGFYIDGERMGVRPIICIK